MFVVHLAHCYPRGFCAMVRLSVQMHSRHDFRPLMCARRAITNGPVSVLTLLCTSSRLLWYLEPLISAVYFVNSIPFALYLGAVLIRGKCSFHLCLCVRKTLFTLFWSVHVILVGPVGPVCMLFLWLEHRHPLFDGFCSSLAFIFVVFHYYCFGLVLHFISTSRLGKLAISSQRLSAERTATQTTWHRQHDTDTDNERHSKDSEW